MPVPKKKHSKSKTGRRRSHLALKTGGLSRCANCGGPKTAHRTCRQCGIK